MNKVKNYLDISNLIAPADFIREAGLTSGDFYTLLGKGRIQGLISIGKRSYVDRSQITINYEKNGYRFALWVKLGGRSAPVSVPAELKRIRLMKEAALSSIVAPDAPKQPTEGDK